MPMGAASAFVEFAAQCEAGGTNAARLDCSVKRSAWLICPGRDFVVAREARKNRQPGGVGGSPRVGTLLVGRQVPDGGRACSSTAEPLGDALYSS